MNNFDDWSQIISKYLKSEADPLGALAKHEMEDDAARAAFIRSVLDRFLPEIYGVGCGQVIDSKGNISDKMDIIIYRRDFPRLDLPGSRDIYLYESVIATVAVVAKLVKKSLFDALNQCASLADLNPDIDTKVITGLAARNQLTLNESRQYIHPDPIRTARFHLVSRPLSFVYAFSGYKTSPKQLADSMQAWIDERRENHQPAEMKELPAVVATQGCFAWRNSAPFTVNERSLMGVGADQAPVRLIVLQMLHVLSRRLKVTTDGYGMRPGLDAYLKRMPPPKFELFIGKAKNPDTGRDAKAGKINPGNTPVPKAKAKSAVTKQVKAQVTAKPALSARPAAIKPPVVKTPGPAPTVSPVPRQKRAVDSALKPKVEIKTRPSLSSTTADKATVSRLVERLDAKTLPTLSPKPEPVDAPFPVPNANLIPELDPNPPGSEGVEDDAINTAFGKLENPGETNQAKVDKKPAPGTAAEKQSNSADNFLETVKMNISSSEPIAHLQPESEAQPEPFTSTIPQ